MDRFYFKEALAKPPSAWFYTAPSMDQLYVQ